MQRRKEDIPISAKSTILSLTPTGCAAKSRQQQQHVSQTRRKNWSCHSCDFCPTLSVFKVRFFSEIGHPGKNVQREQLSLTVWQDISHSFRHFSAYNTNVKLVAFHCSSLSDPFLVTTRENRFQSIAKREREERERRRERREREGATSSKD